MTKELSTRINPEGLEIANTYLELNSIEDTAASLNLPVDRITDMLNKREIKKYIDTVMIDIGYKNRGKLMSVLDKMIESKLEEAEESGIYTSKDLLDVLTLVHKIRVEEERALNNTPHVQTNIQVGDFGQGNYGNLIDKIINGNKK